jgi:hypothetical protein
MRSIDVDAAQSFHNLGAAYELSIVQDTLCVVFACLNSFSDHVSSESPGMAEWVQPLIPLLDSEADRAFAVRLMSLVSLMSNPPRRLIQLAQSLVTKLSLQSLPIPERGNLPEHGSALVGYVNMGEKCPACQTPIMMVHLTTAVCENGHNWGVLFLTGDAVIWGADSLRV